MAEDPTEVVIAERLIEALERIADALERLQVSQSCHSED